MVNLARVKTVSCSLFFKSTSQFFSFKKSYQLLCCFISETKIFNIERLQ